MSLNKPLSTSPDQTGLNWNWFSFLWLAVPIQIQRGILGKNLTVVAVLTFACLENASWGGGAFFMDSRAR